MFIGQPRSAAPVRAYGNTHHACEEQTSLRTGRNALIGNPKSQAGNPKQTQNLDSQSPNGPVRWAQSLGIRAFASWIVSDFEFRAS